MGYAYDSADNLSSITYPDVTKVSYEYDALNRPTAVHLPDGISTYKKYNARDQVEELTTSCDDCGWSLGRYLYIYDDRGYLIAERTEEAREVEVERTGTLVGVVGLPSDDPSGINDDFQNLWGAVFGFKGIRGTRESWSGEEYDGFDSDVYNKKPIKGKEFRGGSKKQRDKWYGINDVDFQKWWEREGKKDGEVWIYKIRIWLGKYMITGSL